MTGHSRLKASGIVLACAIALSLGAHFSRLHAAQSTAFVESSSIDLGSILPPPPPQHSEAVKAELAELHQIERARTPAEIAAAQADEHEEDIFVYRTVLGDNFRAQDLPLTAALSAQVHAEEETASAPLKTEFHRPRPYQFDSTLHPVCGTTSKPNSYPSGHSISGYLEAFTLAAIVPEKSREILERADDYAHNRLVCGVHYPSDLAAGREVAYAVFGYMMATPRFQTELAAARTETRKRLGLN